MKHHATVNRICLSFLGGVLFSVTLTKIITSFIHTDENALQLILKEYPLSASDVLPEPQEMAGFVLFWILYAVFFILLYFILEKRRVKGRDITVYVVGTVLAVTGMYVLLFAEEDKFYTSMSWFVSWRWGWLAIALAAGLFYLSFRLDLSRIVELLAWAVIVFSSVFCFVRNPLFGVNIFHFNGYFSTIFNVFNGATLGVDTPIIYGTYAYLFYPIYKVIGLSLVSYAAVTMLMSLVILVCFWYIIKNLIDQPVLRLFTLSGCAYIEVFFGSHAHRQFITQHFPLRVFFPVIMIAYLLMLAKRKQMLRRAALLGGFFLCYLALMLNLESAITTCLTWISGCFYYMMINETDRRTPPHTVKKAILFAAGLILGIAAAFCMWVGTIEVITYIRAGCFINVSKLYATPFIFAKIGFGMLPLPDHIHIYMFVFLVYALFLGIALKQVFWGIGPGVDRLKGQITFALSVAGILMLLYYMGRTHNLSLFRWLCPCFILIAFLLEHTLALVSVTKQKGEKLCVVITSVILFLTVSVYGTSEPILIKNSSRFHTFLVPQITNDYDEWVDNEISLLQKYEENGTVNYLADYGAGIMMAANVRNAFTGEMASCWFYWDDYAQIEDFLRRCDGNIIIDQTAMNNITTYIPDSFARIMQEKDYQVIDASDRSIVYGRP